MARFRNAAITSSASGIPKYTPILESADDNEMPQQGGMVMTKYGKGTYIYTGYGFFRQLPGGVPDAYRLFTNLIYIEN